VETREVSWWTKITKGIDFCLISPLPLQACVRRLLGTDKRKGLRSSLKPLIVSLEVISDESYRFRVRRGTNELRVEAAGILIWLNDGRTVIIGRVRIMPAQMQLALFGLALFIAFGIWIAFGTTQTFGPLILGIVGLLAWLSVLEPALKPLLNKLCAILNAAQCIDDPRQLVALPADFDPLAAR
jgi:hypothetical protein